jgi:hypothetical protein
VQRHLERLNLSPSAGDRNELIYHERQTIAAAARQRSIKLGEIRKNKKTSKILNTALYWEMKVFIINLILFLETSADTFSKFNVKHSYSSSNVYSTALMISEIHPL